MKLSLRIRQCRHKDSICFIVVALYFLQTSGTVLPTITQTNRMPSIYLKPFKTNGDIRYGHFDMPEACLSSKLSASITLDANCSGLSINFFLRPGSLPIVRPFDAEVPRGVVLPADTLVLSVYFRSGAPPSSSWYGMAETTVELSVSQSGTAASIDCNVFSPVSGSWFFGAYMSVGSSQTKCYTQLFPQVISEVITTIEPLTLYTPVRHRTVDSTEVPHVDTSSFPIRHTRDQLRSRLISNFRPRRHAKYKNNKTFTGRHRKDSNRQVSSQKTPDGKSSAEDKRSAPGLAGMDNKTLISLRLLPTKGKLFRLSVPNDVSGIDLLIEDCFVIPTSAIENQSFTNDRNPSPCPVLLDASRGAIPSALTSHLRQHLRMTNSKSGVLNNGSKFFSSPELPSHRFPGKRYRFDALHGSRVVHYLYLENLASYGTLNLRLSLTKHSACLFSIQSTHPSSLEYQPPDQSKRYSPLLSVLRDNAVANKTKASTETPAPPSEPTFRRLSLLSWLNTNWPELTSERRKRQALMKRNASNYSTYEQDAFVDPNRLEHQTFDKCLVWNAPSRVSMHYAFAYHFTYKPESGQFTNGLRIQPWHAIAIPFELTPGLDTGGSLEVTLQLNPFDLRQHINQTYSLPLPRQVILHACLSRHLPASPYDFVDATRCPLWLRLATHRGMAVSVAHAVFEAVSASLARTQLSHRSELPPSFDISFDEQVDRSFLYLPYPTPGQWFLGLYAECYATADAKWCDDPAATIDIGLVVQSRPCLNYRCRESGEGASLPPSRVLSRATAEIQPSHRTSSPTHRWRPPWWYSPKPDRTAYHSPLVNNTWQTPSLFGEGLCVELLQQSIFASTCACPPGRVGIGCVRPNSTAFANESLLLGRELDELRHMWNGYSKDALLLSLTNLAFLPGICLALARHLWVPALAYTYTLIFSALYHLCDTDVMNIPTRVGLRTISGGASSFGGYSLVRDRGYHVLSTAPTGYHSVPHGFRFTSPACPLPLDILSFCDFFGGVLSVLVTMIAACACPLRYAQLAYVISMLFLSIAVQVARYSVGLFLIPSAVGVIMLAFSWILRTRQTGRLFPPVQWWILSLFPGLVCAGTGLCLFLSPWMARDYTKLHSLWHILIGSSLLGLLPWPSRWRTALAIAIPRSVSLSCGGTIYEQGPSLLRRKITARFSRRRWVSRLIKPSSTTTTSDSSVQNGLTASSVFMPSQAVLNTDRYKRFIEPLLRMLWKVKHIYSTFCIKLDSLLELACLLDAIVTRWPKCQWLLPHGFKSRRSNHVLRVDPSSDLLIVTSDVAHMRSSGDCRSSLAQPKVEITGDNSLATLSNQIV